MGHASNDSTMRDSPGSWSRSCISLAFGMRRKWTVVPRRRSVRSTMSGASNMLHVRRSANGLPSGDAGSDAAVDAEGGGPAVDAHPLPVTVQNNANQTSLLMVAPRVPGTSVTRTRSLYIPRRASGRRLDSVSKRVIETHVSSPAHRVPAALAPGVNTPADPAESHRHVRDRQHQRRPDPRRAQ